MDYILFGSVGGVRALKESGYRIEETKDSAGRICIGPVCAKAYRSWYQAEARIAEKATAESLIREPVKAEKQRKNPVDAEKQTAEGKKKE